MKAAPEPAKSERLSSPELPNREKPDASEEGY